jgi:hypothetical protein
MPQATALVATLLVLSAPALAAPKKGKSPKSAPVTAPAAAPPASLPAKQPAPSAKLVDAPATAGEAVDLVTTLFNSLEYATVIPTAEQALTRADLSLDQRVELYRLLGCAKAATADPVEAEVPFRLMLRAKPDADMSADTAPKFLSVFRKVQTEERALASQLKRVERERLVANLRLMGAPANPAQGGLPITFSYRVRDTAGVVEAVRVSYRRANQRAFSSLALERSVDGEWRGQIPGEFTADERGFTLEYVTETADREGPLLVAGAPTSPLRLEVLAGQVPVKTFKPISRGVFFTSVGVTAAAGVAAGVLGFLFNQEHASFDRAVAGAPAGPSLVAQIQRGESYAVATNVLMLTTAAVAVVTLILLPLTNFSGD